MVGQSLHVGLPGAIHCIVGWPLQSDPLFNAKLDSIFKLRHRLRLMIFLQYTSFDLVPEQVLAVPNVTFLHDVSVLGTYLTEPPPHRGMHMPWS